MENCKKYEILGIGAPIIDHIIRVDEAYVRSLEGGKGGMVLIDYETMNGILCNFHGKSALTIGGSAANTIKGLAKLGNSCGFLGKVGTDSAGQVFSKAMDELGIVSLLSKSTTPTAHSLCLVTPDAERTMRTYLGAAANMHSGDLDPAQFEGLRLVHIEGYNLLKGALVETTLRLAKEAGALVSLDLASYEIVRNHRERLLGLIEQYVDVVIANADEAWALHGLPPKESCYELQKLCTTAVVLFGAGGCWVGQNHTIIHGAPFPSNPIDTTGAGDLFSSGFLHGYLNNRPLHECARVGNMLGSAVVSVLGTEIPPVAWERILENIEI